MDIVTGPGGILSQPDLRDGHILSLRLLDKATLEVGVQTAAGEPYTLVLAGLQRLRCDGFAVTNDIFSAGITRGVQPELEILYRLTGEPPAGEPYRSRHAEWMDELSRDIVEGRLTLVSLEPSYGCALTALCETVQIRGV